MYFWNYKQGSGISFYVSYMYIHTRIIYVVLMERALKVDSNHTKYPKSPKITGFLETTGTNISIKSSLEIVLKLS